MASGGESGVCNVMWIATHLAKSCCPAWGLDGLEEVGEEPSAYLFLIDICHTNYQISVFCQDWFPSWVRKKVGQGQRNTVNHPGRSILLRTFSWLHLTLSESQSPYCGQSGPTQSIPITCDFSSLLQAHGPPQCSTDTRYVPVSGPLHWLFLLLGKLFSHTPYNSLTSFKPLFIYCLCREILISLLYFSLWHYLIISFTYFVYCSSSPLVSAPMFCSPGSLVPGTVPGTQ